MGRSNSSNAGRVFGLPSEAPAFVETPAGSLIRPLERDDWRSFGWRANAGILQFAGTALLGFGIVALGLWLSDENPPNGPMRPTPVTIGIVILGAAVMLGSIPVAVRIGATRRLLLEEAVRSRRKRLVTSTGTTEIVEIRAPHPILGRPFTRGSFALLEAGPGCLKLELPRHQIVLQRDDIELKVKKGLVFGGVDLEARFEAWAWRVCLHNRSRFELGLAARSETERAEELMRTLSTALYSGEEKAKANIPRRPVRDAQAPWWETIQKGQDDGDST